MRTKPLSESLCPRSAEPERPADLRETGMSGDVLDSAAINYYEGIQKGMDEDELVARELGYSSARQLSQTQEEYKDKLKQKLTERAEEIRKEKEGRIKQFNLGKYYYERGQYASSVETLEAALGEEGESSSLGGEIQLWLALAYQACGKEDTCIEIYKSLEKNHPAPAIRRQAAGLRYILEAPRLELGEDEKVTIPVFTEIESNKTTRVGPQKRPRRSSTPPSRVEKSLEDEFWEQYKPPVYLKNRYIVIAGSIVAIGIAWYSAVYNTF